MLNRPMTVGNPYWLLIAVTVIRDCSQSARWLAPACGKH
jgi:hypothetical protein